MLPKVFGKRGAGKKTFSQKGFFPAKLFYKTLFVDFAVFQTEGEGSGAFAGGFEFDFGSQFAGFVKGEHDFQNVVGEFAVGAVFAAGTQSHSHIGCTDTAAVGGIAVSQRNFFPIGIVFIDIAPFAAEEFHR